MTEAEKRKQEEMLEEYTNYLENEFETHGVGGSEWNELITDIEEGGFNSPALYALIYVASKAENVKQREALRDILAQTESLKQESSNEYNNYIQHVTQNLEQADKRQRRLEEAAMKAAAAAEEQEAAAEAAARGARGRGRQAGKFTMDGPSGKVHDNLRGWDVRGRPYGGKKSRRKRRKKSRAKRRRTRR